MSLHLVVIVGPTACGKTRLGVEIAHRVGSEILSADSRQVYRGLDIGTGKDLQEYSSVDPPVAYHLIDVADPKEVYTLFRYQEDCYRILRKKAEEDRFRSGKIFLLMVGGSGLYVEAVVRDYRITDVPQNRELRARLTECKLDDLVTALKQQDHDLLKTTDLTNARRVIRALEIAEYAKSGFVRYSSPLGLDIRFTVFGLRVERQEIRRRVRLRLRSRVENGLVEEVRDLLDGGLNPRRLEALGLEYREMAAYLCGGKSLDQALADLESAIKRFAKRQETWLRGMERRGVEIHWITPNDADKVLEVAVTPPGGLGKPHCHSDSSE